MQKVLGLDYGTKRIGLALSHESLAVPLKILDNNPRVIAEIQQFCRDEDVTKIVVGISENTMEQKTRDFAKKLAINFAVPVVFFDETLSSQQVRSKLKKVGAKSSKRRSPIDHYAAAEILDEWLSTQPLPE